MIEVKRKGETKELHRRQRQIRACPLSRLQRERETGAFEVSLCLGDTGNESCAWSARVAAYRLADRETETEKKTMSSIYYSRGREQAWTEKRHKQERYGIFSALIKTERIRAEQTKIQK